MPQFRSIKKSVGTVWMAEDHESKIPSGFIYDLFVNEPYRRKGVATQAMLLLEEKAKQLGLVEAIRREVAKRRFIV